MRIKYSLFILFYSSFSIANAQVHVGPGQSYPNIQAAANAGVILPGDTVFLHAGTYAGYQAITQLKGTSNDWIVFQPYQNDFIEISGGWQFISCNYIKFQHLTFKGTALHPGRLFSIDNGGSCATQSTHIVVDSCSFSNTTAASAIVAFKFAGVDHFEVTNCQFKDIPACEAMDFNTCHEGIIRGNRFENCLSGGHIKGGASNITIERNLFINASKEPWVAYEIGGDTGPAFYCPGDTFEVKNIHFYANIIIGGYRGLALSSARECRVVNNTFYNCGQATMRFLTTSNLYPALAGNVLENNLFAFGNSAYFNGGTQPAIALSCSNNIYYSLLQPAFNGPYWDSPALDATKDPAPLNYGANSGMFVDAPGFDFNLLAGSPAIGNGKSQVEPTLDFDGKPYAIGSRSIGALEIPLNTSVDVGTDHSKLFLVYPNPATNVIQIYPHDWKGVITVSDINGINWNVTLSDGHINIEHLPSGLYYLHLHNRALPFIKIK